MTPTTGYTELNMCAECGDLSLPDYDYCAGCCWRMAYNDANPKLPGKLANVKLMLLQKLGIGKVQGLFMLGSEVMFATLFHQYVILPSPVGAEMFFEPEHYPVDKAEKIANKSYKVAKKTKFFLSKAKDRVMEAVA